MFHPPFPDTVILGGQYKLAMIFLSHCGFNFKNGKHQNICVFVQETKIIEMIL